MVSAITETSLELTAGEFTEESRQQKRFQMLLFPSGTHPCSFWQGQSTQGRPLMGAGPFTGEKCKAAQGRLLEGHYGAALTWWRFGGGGSIYRKTVGLCGGSVWGKKEPPGSQRRLESTTAELSCVNRTTAACMLGCDLHLQGRWGAVERGPDAESQDRCDFQPQDKVLHFSEPLFP